MHARDVMTAPVHVVSSKETIAHVRNLMVKHRISRLVLMDDGKLTGIITKKDIGYRLREDEPAWRRRPVDQIPVDQLATGSVVAVRPDTSTREIARIFVERDFSSVPVVEDGAVIGIVTKSDLMKSSVFNHMPGSVSDLMEDVLVVSRYHSLDHVIDMMSQRNDKLVVANNDGTLAGIITETNLAFLEPFSRRPGSAQKNITFLRKEDHAGTKMFRYVFEASMIAEDVMSHPVITIGPSARLSEAVTIMEEQKINSLVVVEDSTIMGIIKRDDIIKEVAK
jgi:CBS domain-containing protein